MMGRLPLFAFTALFAFTGLPSSALGQQGGEAIVADHDPIKLELAREIVDLGFPEETREALFFAAIDQSVIQMREATFKAYGLGDEDAGAIAVLDGWMAEYIAENKTILRSHIPALMNGMTLSYAAMFTSTELKDIRDFVATPSGQRFFELSSAVLAEPNFAAANQAYMNEVQSQLPSAMEDLIGRLQQYVSEKAAAESSTST